jgi:hypothetical protein
VDPVNGTVSSASLSTNTWYDHRGEVIEIAQPVGRIFNPSAGPGRIENPS